MEIQSPSPIIAKLTVFRVYYDRTSSKWPIFNNGRLRIPLTVEIEARDSYDQPVLLTNDQLNSIRLCETNSDGTFYKEMPHNPNTVSGWASYHDNDYGYSYEPAIINRLGVLSLDEIKEIASEVDNTVDESEPSPMTVQRVTLWVLTNTTSYASKAFAAKFSQFVSSLEPAKGDFPYVTLTPVRFRYESVTFTHEEVKVGSESAYHHRGYNNYITAHFNGYGEVPLKYIYMPGLWWDRGDAWHTEFSFCYCGHANSATINFGDMKQPEYLIEHSSGKQYTLGSHFKPYADGNIEKPRSGKPVVVMILSEKHMYFQWANGKRADDKTSVRGDVTDRYGNKMDIIFELDKASRSLVLKKS